MADDKTASQAAPGLGTTTIWGQTESHRVPGFPIRHGDSTILEISRTLGAACLFWAAFVRSLVVPGFRVATRIAPSSTSELPKIEAALIGATLFRLTMTTGDLLPSHTRFSRHS